MILVANHRYDLDPFYVSTFLPREMHWVSKYENFTTPIMRTIIAPFGPIPLHRNRNDQTAVYMIRNLLHKNQIVGIFPEGHRSKTGNLSEFHAGSCPILLRVENSLCARSIGRQNNISLGNKLKSEWGM